MKGLSSLPVFLIGIALSVAVLYVFILYTVKSLQLQESQTKAQSIVSASQKTYLRIDNVRLVGSTLVITVTALDTVELNKIAVFLNHRYVGDCSTLSCNDQTNNGYLVLGETGEINAPFPGVCNLPITLEYKGSTTSIVKDDICVWRCRRPITVSSTFDFNNYSILIELNTSNFDFTTTDGNDLRFYDGTTKLDYWVESWSSTAARIWVEVNVVNGDKNIWMYYCNPYTTSESNGYKTFYWFNFDDTNLIAVFHFNETGSTVYDQTGVYGGTIFNATRTSGYYGGGILFDGNDDWVETNVDAGPLELTYALWMKTYIPSSSVSTALYDGVYNRAIGTDNIPRPYVWFSTPETALYGTTNVYNNWHFIVGRVSNSGQFQEIYVDGVLENNAAITSVVTKPAGSTLYLGGEPSGGAVAWDFNGVLDEVILYGRLLTLDEIQALYTGYLDFLSGVWVVRYRRDPEPTVVVGAEEVGEWLLN